MVLPPAAVKVRVSCWARVQDVVVEVPPEVVAKAKRKDPKKDPTKDRGARVFVLFHDASKKKLGGWGGLAIGSGSRDWSRHALTMEVPKGAKTVKAAAGLELARGTAWFDDVRIEALDGSGRPIEVVRQVQTDTSGWYRFDPPAFDHRVKSVFDAAPLVPAPAGLRGFVSARGERLVFADGAPARFWGVNLIADGAFPDHATAQRLAVCLSRFGCNMVRLAFLDAPLRWWGKNIFAPGDDTRHLDPVNLDRLEYLVAQLKRRGIYINLELLSRREFRKHDGIPDHDKLYAGVGLTPALLFDPKLIELQKDHARRLLTHRNPYTKLRWCDDPALAMVSLMNESSMSVLRRPLPVDSHLAPRYQKQLTAMWNAWLRRRYGSRSKLAAAWGAALRAKEDFVGDGIALSDSFEKEGLKKWKGPRLRDGIELLRAVERRYVRDMREYLRGLGVRAAICGSSRTAESDAVAADYVDRHWYWDHPQGGWESSRTIDNQSILAGKRGLRELTDLLGGRFAGKPYAITEWDFCWPNEYRAEGPVVLSACAAAQDCSAVAMYSFGARGGKNKPYDLNYRDRFQWAFSLRSQPTVFCQWPVANMLLVRGDLKPLGRLCIFETPYDNLWKKKRPPGPDEDDDNDERSVPRGLFWKTRLARRFVTGAARWPNVATTDLPADGHLYWRNKAMYIDTPRTQGVVGTLSGGAAVRLADVRMELKTTFCSVTVASLDGQPISSSRRLLITAVARSENTATAYNPARTRLTDPGRSPILIEPVRGRIILRNPRRQWTLTPLDAHACRRPAARTVRGSGTEVRFDIGRDRCLWYELAAAAVQDRRP